MLLNRLPETERVEFGDHVLVGADELTNQPVLRINGTDETLSRIQRSSWDDGGDDVFDEEEVGRMNGILKRFLLTK